MFAASGFAWRGFAVALSPATAADVGECRAVGGVVYFDNGRRRLSVAVPVPVLPEAWRDLPLPAGYICPLLGQLALLRGEAPEWDAADKCLRLGGRLLLGTAGKIYAFSTQASADMWVSVNRAKAEKELILLAELPADSLAVLRAKKAEAMGRRAGTVTANAARQKDAQKAVAMAAEADFYLTKWGS